MSGNWGQDHVKVDVDEQNLSGRMGGGLIFALMDAWENSSRIKLAESAESALQRKLERGSFAETIRTELSEGLSKNALFSGEIYFSDKNDSGTLYRFVTSSSADAVLVLPIEYSFSHDFSGLSIHANPVLIPKSAALIDMQISIYAGRKSGATKKSDAFINDSSIYANRLAYSVLVPPEITDKDQALAYWKEDTSKKLSGSFTDGTRILIQLLLDDLGKKSVRFHSSDKLVTPVRESYQIIWNQKSITVHRNSDGSLTAITYL